MATRSYSIHLCVDSYLRRPFPEGYEGVFVTSEGSRLSAADAVLFLTLEKAKGRKVIPCGDGCGNPCGHAANGCTGFDYTGGGCPGRLVNG